MPLIRPVSEIESLTDTSSRRLVDIHALYDSVAADYSRDEAKFRDDLISRPLIVDLARILAHKGQVLDFGCGDGHISRLIGPFVRNVLGIDLSNSMLEQARTRSVGVSNVQFINMNFLNFASVYPTGHFDLCVAVYALCCLKTQTQLRWAFHQMYQAIKSRGYVVIQIPHPGEIDSQSRSNWAEDIDRCCEEDSPTLLRRNLRTVDDKWVLVARYHHSLTDYLEAIDSSGFKIEETFEPLATSDILRSYPDLKHESQVPSSIIFVARKG
jgi:SAM-dependent methyltransferase